MADHLRIEIWADESMQWSLEGDSSALQYEQASIKLRSLFPEQNELRLVLNKDDVQKVDRAYAIDEVKKLGGNDNLMITDVDYTKMMMFIYS